MALQLRESQEAALQVGPDVETLTGCYTTAGDQCMVRMAGQRRSGPPLLWRTWGLIISEQLSDLAAFLFSFLTVAQLQPDPYPQLALHVCRAVPDGELVPSHYLWRLLAQVTVIWIMGQRLRSEQQLMSIEFLWLANFAASSLDKKMRNAWAVDDSATWDKCVHRFFNFSTIGSNILSGTHLLPPKTSVASSTGSRMATTSLAAFQW